MRLTFRSTTSRSAGLLLAAAGALGLDPIALPFGAFAVTELDIGTACDFLRSVMTESTEAEAELLAFAFIPGDDGRAALAILRGKFLLGTVGLHPAGQGRFIAFEMNIGSGPDGPITRQDLLRLASDWAESASITLYAF